MSAATASNAVAPGGLPALAVTMGDPAGIGPDITLMAWHERQTHALPPFAVYGDRAVLKARAAMLGLDTPIRTVPTANEARGHFASSLPIVDIPTAETCVPGTPRTANAAAVIAAIDRAVADVKAGSAAAIVTNPIAKSVLKAAGFSHPGHTEYLGELARRHWPQETVEPIMMLSSAALRVVPVTIHVPLRQVPGLLTQDLIISTLRTTDRALRNDFGIARPRIAVAGLNPHAGEQSTIGCEDAEIIAPALAALKRDGIDVIGPLAADTMFHAAARAGYDAAVAMYHDQALIPIKTLAFDEGVNVTLGLPLVRTSPDHGTAFALAGSGLARHSSFVEAVMLAARMAARRANATAAQAQ